jgi:hypothetical protein
MANKKQTLFFALCSPLATYLQSNIECQFLSPLTTGVGPTAKARCNILKHLPSFMKAKQRPPFRQQ